ncbi:MAG: adenylate/guanylate cyclase domain-containing protein [Phreatobacter sp.]|uniref:CHASE2 domain-containing protein n=1 Tax=Phreatobacter sp. TaxID=1966341 RepID=UPI00273553A6|nr:adenylate/guanylate cyclase domain-containing protein [Phreatobacter sp.]MDP2800967.1 adenylate/guanylate cyclase domain-containing protein [Phreatobacter sp.]
MALAAGALAAIMGVAIYFFVEAGPASRLRENGYALIGRFFPRTAPPGTPVMVVDIDRASLSLMGPWPWSREKLATLIDRIAAAEPQVLGVDIVLSDRRDDEGTPLLAAAIGKVPTILGAVLDPEQVTAAVVQPLSIVVVGDGRDVQVPEAPGVIVAPEPFFLAARGIGIVSFLAGDEVSGQVITASPLVVSAQGQPLAGLGLALVQARFDASSVIIDVPGGRLRVGEASVPLTSDLSLRLHHGRADDRVARTISATRLLRGDDSSALKGRIVLLGASAPEIGGLRATHTDPFMPSVQIIAETVEQILGGQAPVTPPHGRSAEIAMTFIIALGGMIAVLVTSPFIATAISLVLAAGWIGLCLALFAFAGFLIDPLGPPLIGLIPVQVTALILFSATLRERRAIERRFAQHLPAEVVARIADDPSRIKIDGEEREITALFTDIEGFTAMTERASPKDLIALLDAYVEMTAGIVIAHGGMVDKVVGDALHAFFNAPMDCDDHPKKALDCARQMLAATEQLRTSPLGAKLKLGRTRIGIETGPAILGDIGGGRKLDYTAHGPAINAAAKLEAANKTFGTSILIGPGAAARLQAEDLRPVGAWQASPASEPRTVFTV